MGLAQSNAIKLNLLALPFGNIAGSYELQFSENQSFALHASFQIPGELPNYITNNVDGLSFSEQSGFAITPEYRRYLREDTNPSGFYFAPYFRYSRSDLEVAGTFESYPATGKGSFTAVGPGIQLGNQWVISDIIVIDWNFLGLSLNRYKFNMQLTPDSDAVDLQAFNQQVVEAAGNIPILGKRIQKRIQVDEASNTLKANFPFWFLGLRTGLSVGVLF